MKKIIVIVLVTVMLAVPSLAQSGLSLEIKASALFKGLQLSYAATSVALDLAKAKPAPEVKVSDLFRGLQINYTAMNWSDLLITTWALKTGDYGEANPIARFYVDHTGYAMCILLVADLVIHVGTTQIYKGGNKTLAWALLIGMTAVKGYVLYHNLKIAR